MSQNFGESWQILSNDTQEFELYYDFFDAPVENQSSHLLIMWSHKTNHLNKTISSTVKFFDMSKLTLVYESSAHEEVIRIFYLKDLIVILSRNQFAQNLIQFIFEQNHKLQV